MNRALTSRNRKILAMARKGFTLREIADTTELSFQRVHQILQSSGWSKPPAIPRPVPPRPPCVLCGEPVPPRRSRYCSDEHYLAIRMLRTKTQGYQKLRVQQARSIIRNHTKHSQADVDHARRMLKDGFVIPLRIHQNSKTYHLLADNGLLRHLPKTIQIVS